MAVKFIAMPKRNKNVQPRRSNEKKQKQNSNHRDSHDEATEQMVAF